MMFDFFENLTLLKKDEPRKPAQTPQKAPQPQQETTLNGTVLTAESAVTLGIEQMLVTAKIDGGSTLGTGMVAAALRAGSGKERSRWAVLDIQVPGGSNILKVGMSVILLLQQVSPLTIGSSIETGDRLVLQ